MRTITLTNPALTTAPTAWTTARADLMARASELRARTTPAPDEESPDPAAGTPGDEALMTEKAQPEAAAAGPVGQRSYLDRERNRRAQAAEAGEVERVAVDAEDAGDAAEPETGSARREETKSESVQVRELAREPEQVRGAGSVRRGPAESEPAQVPKLAPEQEQERKAGTAQREETESEPVQLPELAREPEQERAAGSVRHLQAESEPAAHGPKPEQEQEAGTAPHEQAESEPVQVPELAREPVQERRAGAVRHVQAESEPAQVPKLAPEQEREAGAAQREETESESVQVPELAREPEQERAAGSVRRVQAESDPAQVPEQERETGAAPHDQAESEPVPELAREPVQERRAGAVRHVQAESEPAQVPKLAPEQERGAGAAQRERVEPDSGMREPEAVPVQERGAGAVRREQGESEVAQVPEQRRGVRAVAGSGPEPAVSGPESGHGAETGPDLGDSESVRMSGAPIRKASDSVPAMPISQASYLDRERAERKRRVEAEEVADEPEAEARPAEQRPLLRRERALDPDWIGARPLFRDEAPTRPLPRIEFEPSEPAEGADAAPPRKVPRIAPMRSVVLGAQVDPVGQGVGRPLPGADSEPEADPPTLIDRMPPIDPDELVVPEFLSPGFIPPMAPLKPTANRPPLPQRQRRPRPGPAAAAAADPPTLVDPHPAVVPAPTRAATPTPTAAKGGATARAAATTGPTTTPATTAATSAARPDDIAVPDFIVPGFAEPAPEPPLRTVLSTVLGPELWQRCYAEWSPAHCTALARIARNVDGLAPSAGAAVRSTAGAGMRWLGVAREREMLADLVAGAISHPAGATSANQARTVRLYGAAICMALNVPLRRCACHRDLERDVSGELIRLGLEELAGEVP
ncbi:hypothetical protein [Catenulispora sp. EB89]|uniref:hypothetical protein n=1 Tax=Catenulispora sp. EB89 TaxID=3156257 RepID=UPI00351813F8